jgi:putative transposase
LLRFPLGPLFSGLFASFFASFRTRAALPLEILALRHQVCVLQRSVKRPQLTQLDRFLWAGLGAAWQGRQSCLFLVQPSMVIGWHRKGFRLFWTGKIRQGQRGRPAVPKDIRKLIRTMSRENPLWGTAHSQRVTEAGHRGRRNEREQIHDLSSETTPPQTWRTFLEIMSKAECRSTS